MVYGKTIKLKLIGQKGILPREKIVLKARLNKTWLQVLQNADELKNIDLDNKFICTKNYAATRPVKGKGRKAELIERIEPFVAKYRKKLSMHTVRICNRIERNCEPNRKENQRKSQRTPAIRLKIKSVNSLAPEVINQYPVDPVHFNGIDPGENATTPQVDHVEEVPLQAGHAPEVINQYPVDPVHFDGIDPGENATTPQVYHVEEVPLQAGHAPVVSGHAPVVSGHAPVVSGHAPAASGHAPVASGHAPVASGHAPVASGHAPVVSGLETPIDMDASPGPRNYLPGSETARTTNSQDVEFVHFLLPNVEFEDIRDVVLHRIQKISNVNLLKAKNDFMKLKEDYDRFDSFAKHHNDLLHVMREIFGV